MKRNIRFIAGVVAAALPLTLPASGADNNRTLEVRTIIKTHDAAYSGKTGPGPSNLAKSTGDAGAAEKGPQVEITRTPKEGTGK